MVALIYTHTHGDHYGGAKGIVSDADVKAGRVRVVAPQDFMEHAVRENVFAGTAMSRRSVYMFGPLLPRTPTGQVDAGNGKAVSLGIAGLLPPTESIGRTGQTLTIDGVEFVFQYTPDTEAPAEMNFYLPKSRALCMAENATHTMHNLYTPRGAQARDAKAWARHLDDAITLFGDKTDVMLQDQRLSMGGEVVNHVVSADPNNQEARRLEADALEQLGYQAESTVWRNFYLTGALELRRGSQSFRPGPSRHLTSSRA